MLYEFLTTKQLTFFRVFIKCQHLKLNTLKGNPENPIKLFLNFYKELRTCKKSFITFFKF